MPTTKPFAIKGRRVAGNPAATAAGIPLREVLLIAGRARAILEP